MVLSMKTIIVGNIVLSTLHVLLMQSSHPPYKIDVIALSIGHIRKQRR